MSETDSLRRRIVQRLQQFRDSREPRHEIIWGLLGDVDGTVSVPNQSGKVYCRLLGISSNVVRAWNASVPLVANLRVDVEVERQEGMPDDYAIIGVAKVAYVGYGDKSRFYVPPHHETHEYSSGVGGYDIVNVYTRMLAELRADAQATPNMTVAISAGMYMTDTTLVIRSAATSPTFSAAPAAGYSRFDLLYLNTANNAYEISKGDAALAGYAVRPLPSSKHIAIAWVFIQAGNTAITNSMIIDARVLWLPIGALRAGQVAQVGAPTYTEIQDWINTTQSAGLISGGAITATSYAIAEADEVAETFKIAGDVTAYFTDGIVFTVSGSTGNDGDYTTVGDSTYAAGVTTITVANVPDGTDDGNIADGRVDVATGAGMIKKTNDEIDGITAFFDWPTTANILLVNNSVNWLYATYGGGVPAVAATDTYTGIDHTTEFPIGRVYREGTVLHILQSGMYIYNATQRMHRRTLELRRVERATGAVITDKGTRKFSLTAGVHYSGIDRLPTDAFDSSGADRFKIWYHSGGVWTSSARDQSQIDNTQYDNGTDLANLSPNEFGVHWVFLHHDNHVDVVFGRDSYKLYAAEDATLPAIPNICDEFAVLVGRIIVERNAAELTETSSAFQIYFNVTEPADHSDLANLDLISGGHTLTGAQWSLVGATALNTIGLLTPSADVSAGVEAILKSTAAGDLALHDLTLTNDLILADGSVIGITGNERIQFNAIGTIQVLGADVLMGSEDGGAKLNFDEGTTIANGIAWGSDANKVTLYRSADDVLKTDDQLIVVGDISTGVDDTTPGMIRAYGGGAANREGGELQLYTAADHDGVIQFYGLDAYDDDFRIYDAPGNVRFRISDVGTVTIYQGLNVGTATGAAVNQVAIGGAPSSKLTIGLTINQGANDNEIITLQSSDVAHGMTTRANTNTYGFLQKSQATSGGLAIHGLKDADGIAGYALFLKGMLGEAADTGKTTAAVGVIQMTAEVKSNSSSGAVGADGNLLVITNYSLTRFIFDGEGSAHADVEWTTFQDHDDCQLLTHLEDSMLEWRDPIKSEFGSFLGENALALERLGIVHFDRDLPSHAMLNTTRLAMLHTGAIRQLNDYRLDADAEREAIRAEIVGLQEKLNQMERRG